MYEGENCLNEYCVYDITMSIESVKNITIARVKIKIARRVEGLILTAFIPTLILNIIGHMSNYFKECFFEGLMALNVTVMLALTTMFLRYEMFTQYYPLGFKTNIYYVIPFILSWMYRNRKHISIQQYFVCSRHTVQCVNKKWKK